MLDLLIGIILIILTTLVVTKVYNLNDKIKKYWKQIVAGGAAVVIVSSGVLMLSPPPTGNEVIIGSPFNYEYFSAPSNSLGCGNQVIQTINWSWIEDHTTYHLTRDGINVTDTLQANWSYYFSNHKYNYSFIAGAKGYFEFTMTFNSQSNSSYINESSHTAFFNYTDEGQLFYNFSDIWSIVGQFDSSFQIVDNVFTMVLGKQLNKNVRVDLDPTYGTTSIVTGYDTLLMYDEPGYEEYQKGLKFYVSASSISIDNITLWVSINSPNNIDVKCCIYTGDGGTETVVSNSVTGIESLGDVDNGWNTFEFVSSNPVLTTGYYYLVALGDADDFSDFGESVDIHKSGTGSNTFIYSKNNIYPAFPTFDSSWGSGTEYQTDASADMSFYCNYTIPNSPATINITYVGNTTYNNTVLYLPPLDVTTYELAPDGYFANGSYIPEDVITVQANVTSDYTIISVKLHVYDATADSWDNTSSMSFVSGNLYTINKTTFISGHKYSFDVYAEDEWSVGSTQPWYKNKTVNPDIMQRRYVYMNCDPDNDAFEYNPFYMWNITTEEIPKCTEDNPPITRCFNSYEGKDIYYQDQRITSHSDSGILRLDNPTAETQYTYCGASIWLTISHLNNANTICINETAITNAYFREWWSNNTFSGNSSQSIFGFNITNDVAFMAPAYQKTFLSSNKRALLDISDLTSSNWIPDYITHIQLATGKISFSSPFYVDSNSVYRIFYSQSAGGGAFNFCNISYKSYVLFNLPDNTTLQSMYSDGDSYSDYAELFTYYTSPFHDDTDGDGQDDDVDPEPNIYNVGAKTTDIRTNGDDYFVWMGQNMSAYGVAQNITSAGITFGSGEYIALWNATTWDANWYTEGAWQQYHPANDTGENWTVHTFDVVKTYITDNIGEKTVSMAENTAMSYTASYSYNWVNTSANKGYNYTGLNQRSDTSLSAINTSVTLQDGEGIALWNETTYTWNWWLPGFYEVDKTVHEYDVIISKVENLEVWNT